MRRAGRSITISPPGIVGATGFRESAPWPNVKTHKPGITGLASRGGAMQARCRRPERHREVRWFEGATSWVPSASGRGDATVRVDLSPTILLFRYTLKRTRPSSGLIHF